jgi:ethanolamine ammonia-lyase small subunit
MSPDRPPPDPWARLRGFTAARIALGHTGGSAPTAAVLGFNHDHALARDAVHAPFDAAGLAVVFQRIPHAPAVLTLESAAPDRAVYLRRPDLGRQLSAGSRAALVGAAPAVRSDLVLIVSDGLSALAAHRQGPPLVAALLPRLRDAGFSLAPLCVVRHARVGVLGDFEGADYDESSTRLVVVGRKD